MHLRKLKTLVAAAVALVSLDGSAQDLLASQAPIDRTLKSVDSLSLKLQLMAEDLEYPAFDLYEENWDTRFVNAYKGIAVPDSFRIDLTGYAMPTESRRITSKYGYRWRRMHRGLDVKVYVGDTITAVATVIEKMEEKHRVKIKTECYNQKDELVIVGEGQEYIM